MTRAFVAENGGEGGGGCEACKSGGMVPAADPEKALRRLWRQIPSTHCKGLCEASCGPIGMSDTERALLECHLSPIPSAADQLGAYRRHPDTYRCPLLVDGRCSAYDDRPTVCRLWGAEETMRCPWGCIPDGGFLTRLEGQLILTRSWDIGGDASGDMAGLLEALRGP